MTKGTSGKSGKFSEASPTGIYPEGHVALKKSLKNSPSPSNISLVDPSSIISEEVNKLSKSPSSRVMTKGMSIEHDAHMQRSPSSKFQQLS